MTEKQLQQAVVECARLLGWRVYHTYDSRRSQAGFPDLCLVRHETIAFAELKTEKGKVSPEQEGWLDSLKAAYTDTYVWRPSDWLSGAIEQVLLGVGAAR